MSLLAATAMDPKAATLNRVPARGDGPTAAKMDGMPGVWYEGGVEFDVVACRCRVCRERESCNSDVLPTSHNKADQVDTAAGGWVHSRLRTTCH